MKYLLWLREYNKESTARWDKVAGTLPKFVSLQESGLKGPVPIHQKEKLPSRLKAMFKPDKSIE